IGLIGVMKEPSLNNFQVRSVLSLDKTRTKIQRAHKIFKFTFGKRVNVFLHGVERLRLTVWCVKILILTVLQIYRRKASSTSTVSTGGAHHFALTYYKGAAKYDKRRIAKV
ncbi:hypothetical protein K0M31_007383, partial [Melipona bicolor]